MAATNITIRTDAMIKAQAESILKNWLGHTDIHITLDTLINQVMKED